MNVPDSYIVSLIPKAEIEIDADLLLRSPFRSPNQLSEEINRNDEDKIAQIVRRELKSQKSEDMILKLSKNILTQLFKLLYTRRAMWRDQLSTATD